MKSRDALTFGLLAILALASLAAAQDRSAAMNQTLDQPVKIQFDSVLPEAMNVITRSTGVRVEAEQAVWDILPWGQQTNVNARIENQTLRQALDAITRKLGLTYVIRDDFVELQPSPALRRIGRRATIDELQLLDLMTSKPFDRKADRATVRQIVDSIDSKLAELKTPFDIEYRPGDAGDPDKAVFIPRAATLADALDSIAKETELSWYPDGKSVVVLPKEQLVRRQLARSVTMRFAGEDVAQVLNELSQRAGVRFEYESGAIQRIPRETRNIQLMLDNSSINQVLDSVCAFTGLGYMITPRGVYIWFDAYDRQTGPRDRAIGMMTLPDSGIQIFIMESQVPPDMRQYINLRRETELGKIRQLMKEQGFRPTTAPNSDANQPATQTDHDL